METEVSQQPAPEPTRPFCWPRAAMWVAITALLLGAFLYVFKQLRDFPKEALQSAGQAFNSAGNALVTVASAFNQGTVTTSFFTFATTINPRQNFQFARLKQMELFSRKEESSTAFGYIRLPDVVVEARAPVEYTYFLDLNAKWEFLLRTNVIYVLPPPIKYNEPAVDVSSMTFEVRKGSVFRNSTEAQQNLKQSITYLAHRKARANIELVRETCRRQTEEFVARWLAKSFADGEDFTVKVFFANETSNADLSSAVPLEN